MSGSIRHTLACLLTLACASTAAASDSLCDSSYTDCRAQLYQLIDHETVGIDAAFWFMKDQTIVSHIVARWKAGVRVRLLVDPRANAPYPANATALSTFKSAGVPMRDKVDGGILHAKIMLFAGQQIVEFGSANYSQPAWVPVAPYTNYEAETICISDDPELVGSYETKLDDLWTDTAAYADYANVTDRTRAYPIFSISPDLNFPPGEDFADRTTARLDVETQKIDVIMYRFDDRRFSDALIAAHDRGVPIRYIGETSEYRDPARLWIAWNMDRVYAAGIPMRVRASQGLNHEKLALLYGQGLSIFGSANWAVDSANSQQEDNYFTTKPGIFSWFADQFERKWNNTVATETRHFSPQPPTVAAGVAPASGAVGVDPAAVALTWYGGPWAHVYDIYFGADPNPPLFAADQALGPSETSTTYQTFALPPLATGTTYYWKIVSKTAAGRTATSPVWSFTTETSAASPPPTVDPTPNPTPTPAPAPTPTPSSGTVVLWAAGVPASTVHGQWQSLADATAAGGAALWNPDAGQPKASASASPANYWDATFTADAGRPYHLWIRLRAQNDAFGNDSISVQFSDAVDASGAPMARIGTTNGASVILEDGSTGAADHGWGWADNGWGAPGADVYFATAGPQTIRIQQREDGAIVDQIVLSADTYLASPPGPRRDDATILPETDSTATDGSSTTSDPEPPPAPPPTDPPSSGGTIVLAASNVDPANVHGNWQAIADATAEGGGALWNPNAGQAKLPAGASPANYWEMTFDANAGTAYHLWVRLRAENDAFGNDSVSVQFSDAVDANGAPVLRIGTTNGASVILEDGSTGAADHGWGWADNGWAVAGAPIYFATTGPHTIRIQQREDGAIVDQIVLSPDTYLSTPPGPRRDDSTLLVPSP